jgi:colicin import membrane protein
MDVAQEIKERIISAAVALFEESGRRDFPTVAAVRSRAGSDMNATSTVMREWRRAQTAQAAPVAVEVPEKVRAASITALGVLWAQAQELANDSLASFQAAWDAERAEAEALRGELSEAFEGLRRDLEKAHGSIASIEAERDAVINELTELRQQLTATTERANTADVRAIEIERRANDLSTELARVHEEATAARDRHASDMTTARTELDQVRAESVKLQAQAERLAHIKTECDDARKAASDAREEAARLAGQLAAHREQNAAMLARLAPAESKAATKPKKTTT